MWNTYSRKKDYFIDVIYFVRSKKREREKKLSFIAGVEYFIKSSSRMTMFSVRYCETCVSPSLTAAFAFNSLYAANVNNRTSWEMHNKRMSSVLEKNRLLIPFFFSPLDIYQQHFYIFYIPRCFLFASFNRKFMPFTIMKVNEHRLQCKWVKNAISKTRWITARDYYSWGECLAETSVFHYWAHAPSHPTWKSFILSHILDERVCIIFFFNFTNIQRDGITRKLVSLLHFSSFMQRWRQDALLKQEIRKKFSHFVDMSQEFELSDTINFHVLWNGEFEKQIEAVLRKLFKSFKHFEHPQKKKKQIKQQISQIDLKGFFFAQASFVESLIDMCKKLRIERAYEKADKNYTESRKSESHM